MRLRSGLLALVTVVWLAFPTPSPAPLVYRPGEGWVYEPVGGTGKWTRTRAKDQLEVAEKAFESKDYKTAIRAAKRTSRVWPFSDYAPRAQYLAGRAYEERGDDERAFREYQKVLDKYPKIDNYAEILQRQYEITGRYLAGKWFKLWGYIPFFPNMNRVSDMYDQLIRNGPFSEVAPQAQMNIGTAREKQANFILAVRAYERAADRYYDRPQVAADALYKAGVAYFRQAKTAEYDQSIAGQAIATFGDFMTLYPEDARLPEAQKMIAQLRTEQARGSYEIARYYEKRKRWDGALVYYGDVVSKDPDSPRAEEAKRKIEDLRKRTANAQPEPQAQSK